MTESEATNFREQARRCLEEAGKARDPRDQQAWQSLADDLIKLATALERAGAAK